MVSSDFEKEELVDSIITKVAKDKSYKRKFVNFINEYIEEKSTLKGDFIKVGNYRVFMGGNGSLGHNDTIDIDIDKDFGNMVMDIGYNISPVVYFSIFSDTIQKRLISISNM